MSSVDDRTPEGMPIVAVARTLTAAVLAALVVGAALPSTSASFSDSVELESNTMETGTLPPSVPTASSVTPTSVTFTWSAAPDGGSVPHYTLERTDAAGATTTIYAGEDTSYTDLDGLPENSYRLTVAIGGWHAVSPEVSVTTEAPE